jgi:hypothetical protein
VGPTNVFRQRPWVWGVVLSVVFMGLIGALAVATRRLSLNPTCPIIPTYPSAVLVSYTERAQITRISTYEVAAQSNEVLTYFMEQLKMNGWEVENGDADGFSMYYRTTNDKPPFSFGITILNQNTDLVQYRVFLRIEGPFSWNYWCSELKP